MGNRIFVTKIPPEMKEEDLRSYFDSFGKIHDFYMPMGRDSHKGMAFLSLEEAADKELILQNSPHTIMGYEVVADDAKPMGKQYDEYPPWGMQDNQDQANNGER